MPFEFGIDESINIKNISKKIQSLKDLIFYYPENNVNQNLYVVILDDIYNQTEIAKIKNVLFRLLGRNIAIVNSLKIKPDNKDLKNNVTVFYYQNRFDFEKCPEFQNKNLTILTSGRALYSLTKDDLQVDYFYDVITNPKSFVYVPFVNAYVFPLPCFRDIFAFDSPNKIFHEIYQSKFAQFQLGRAKEFTERKWQLPYKEKEFNEPIIHDIKSKDEFVAVLKELKNYSHVAWDLETSGLHFKKHRIGYLTFSCDGVNGYFVPWEFVNKRFLNEWLKSKIQIGANLKFDVKFLWENGIESAYVHEDIVQLGHVLNENRANSLKTNTWFYTNLGGYEFELDEYLAKTKNQNYLDIPKSILRKYAVYDAIATYRVWANQMAHLEWVDKEFPNYKAHGQSLSWYYHQIMMPSLNVFAKMEYDGIYISMERLNQAKQDCQRKIETIKKELAQLLNVSEDFDFNSLPKLGNLLKERGWKNYGESKTGFYLTGDDQLARWIQDGHHEAKLIMELRSLNTLLRTFIGENENEGWQKHIIKHNDGSYRMHANYAHMLADTGRSKCKDPNLQQIPRDGVVPTLIDTPNNDDYVILSIDYSSLQVRLAAIDGRDETIAQIYGGGDSMTKDFHSNTAYPIFVKNKNFIEVELENGSTKYFAENDLVTVYRNGKKITIPAGNLLIEDDIVDIEN